MKKTKTLKALSIIFGLLVLTTLGCEKEKPLEVTVEKTETYVFENQEYIVRLIQKDGEFVPVENETTKMLDELMSGPTSSIYVDAKTSKIFLFSTSTELDVFLSEIKSVNRMEKGKHLKSGDEWGAVTFSYEGDDPIRYPYGTAISGITQPLYPDLYSAEVYNYPQMSLFNCDNQISQVDIIANYNADIGGITVTLCENEYYYGHRLSLNAPRDNVYHTFKLWDITMVKKLFGRITWDNQTSSIYINL